MKNEFLGIEYEGIPFGPGPGAINGISPEAIRDRIADLCMSPAGIIYYGSIGSRFNEGNSGTTYFHDPITGDTVNALGLPGLGIDRAEPIIRRASELCEEDRKVLVVSASTLAGESAPEVLPELVERIIEAGAPVVEVNYSCPNIVTSGGGRKPILGYDLDAILETREAIVDRVGTDQKIIEKLPPYVREYEDMITDVAGLYLGQVGRGVVAVSGFNTIPGVTLERLGKPVLRIVAEVDGEEVVTHAGGLSGLRQADLMFEMQQRLGGELPRGIGFVAANGVATGAEVLRRTSEGVCPAIAAVAVTPFFEGEKAGKSYGRVASQIAQEYFEAQEAA